MFKTYLVKKDDVVIYVGHTSDLPRRIRQHRHNDLIGVFVTLGEYADQQQAIKAERVHIALYRDTVSNKQEQYYTGLSARDVLMSRG